MPVPIAPQVPTRSEPGGAELDQLLVDDPGARAAHSGRLHADRRALERPRVAEHPALLVDELGVVEEASRRCRSPAADRLDTAPPRRSRPARRAGGSASRRTITGASAATRGTVRRMSRGHVRRHLHGAAQPPDVGVPLPPRDPPPDLRSGCGATPPSSLAFLQWFVILFTGRRNEGMWNFQRGYLGYNARVSSYVSLLYDEYPNFGSAWGDEPVAFGLDYRPDANRLTNALASDLDHPGVVHRPLPRDRRGVRRCSLRGSSSSSPAEHPRGMWDFILRVYRFSFNALRLRPADDRRVPALRRFGADGRASARRPPRIVRHRSAAQPVAPLPPPSGPPVG